MSLITQTLAGPLIVAHRGASHDAPENTMAAFRLGFEQHADAIEGDFWLTADGQIVAFHDKDTRRVTGGAVDRLVSEMTLVELQQLDVGSWKDPRFASERPPALADVLAILPEGKLFFIEIKCGPEIVPEMKRVIERSGVSLQQLRVISFNADVIAETKRVIPEMKAYWLSSYRTDRATGAVTPTHDEILATLHRTSADGFDGKADLAQLTPQFVQRLRDAGYELHVWTVNDLDLARQLVRLGVDSITTDRPAFLRAGLIAE
ncbi:MAG TPA: glycerophosphodiester phosphodiesterase [Tepidisphaeraceae bacterium]|nr:glycerophosphodiester phosphodiesterase [Tepidisphaeraceae bacterium]